VQNRFSRAAADAAGNCSTNAKKRFEADGETVVASQPSSVAANEERKLRKESSLGGSGMHLFTHHTD
jgi:hypothetical protein